MPAARTDEVNFDARNLALEGLLTDDESYVMPKYQRDFCWGIDQLDEFWSDVSDIINSDAEHYLGQFLFERKGNAINEVVDGQQRLTTIMLLLIAAEKNIYEKQSQTGTAHQPQFLSYYTRLSSEKDDANMPRLVLNSQNQTYFNHLVQSRGVPSSRLHAPRGKQLHEAYKYFYRKFKKFKSDSEVSMFVRSFLNRVMVTVVYTDQDISTFRLFECLNNRGVKLTQSDMIKNHLFSVAEAKAGSTMVAVTSHWNAIKNAENTRTDEFVRVVSMIHDGYMSPKEVYGYVTGKVNTPTEARSFLETLLVHIEEYPALLDTHAVYWHDHVDLRRRVEAQLNDLKIIGKHTHMPLLLAGLNRYKADKFVELLNIVEKFIVRFNIVGGHERSAQERIFADLAKEIWDGKITPREVFAVLQERQPKNEEFKEAMMILELVIDLHAKEICYLLQKYEARLSNRIVLEHFTIEHVLPQNPSPEWGNDFGSGIMDNPQHRLGNYAMLSGRANARLANKTFDLKRDTLMNSEYEISRMIGRYQTWNFEALCEHQERLAEIALEIW